MHFSNVRSILFLATILVFARCRQETQHVPTPSNAQSHGPGSLIKQHEELLSQAKSISASNDSAALKLYEILQYHFSEEEQYVFPVLAILPGLAEGKIPENSDEISKLIQQFKSNSAKLLAEHQMIKTLMEEFKLRSKVQNDTIFHAFEKALAEHAAIEEEICFPAIVTIGDYLKLRSSSLKQ